MFLPLSLPIWNHLPELAFLQFPWRLLTILSAVLALSIAVLLNRPTRTGAPRLASETWVRTISTIVASLAIPLTLGLITFHLYAQFCQPTDPPTAIASLLQSHYGFSPTDEYTPNNADNDVLRTTDPAYWLLPPTANPNTPAPNTLPTATELNPNLDTDYYSVPLNQRLSTPTPQHLSLHTTIPEHQVLNLRDYPAWDVTESDSNSKSLTHPPHTPRDDGLIEIPLDHASDYTINIQWHTTPDQQLGLALSSAALLVLLWLSLRPQASTLPSDH
jgi:hypothetical protein